jgi:hypothetical protein
MTAIAISSEVLSLSELTNSFPNEWILLGNPVFDESKLTVLAGIPIYHSQDKKEVCYMGKEKTADYTTITLIYTGKIKSTRKITGIFNRVKR